MAKITAKRLLKEDLQKDSKEALPTWVDPFIYVFNLFLEQVTRAFSKGLTFEENILSETKLIRFTTGSTYTANDFTVQKIKWNNTTTKPTGVIVLSAILVAVAGVAVNYTPLYTAVFCDWLYVNGQVEIRYISGLANDSTYEVRLLVV